MTEPRSLERLLRPGLCSPLLSWHFIRTTGHNPTSVMILKGNCLPSHVPVTWLRYVTHIRLVSTPYPLIPTTQQWEETQSSLFSISTKLRVVILNPGWASPFACACVFTHLRACMWRPDVYMRYLLPSLYTLLIEAGSPPHQQIWSSLLLASLASQWTQRSSVPVSQVLGL